VVIAHIRQPLSSMTTMNDQNAYAGSDKDALIESLRAELSVLEKQVGEFNDLRLSIVKVAGKNGVRKLKSKVLTSSDRLNGYHIGCRQSGKSGARTQGVSVSVFSVRSEYHGR